MVTNILVHKFKVKFAQMLCSTDLYKIKKYYKWSGLFSYIYGRNVKKITAKNELEPTLDHQKPNFLPSIKKYQF